MTFIHSFLFLALLAPTQCFAATEKEKIALADASETFAAFDKSVTDLCASTSPLREFNFHRFLLESKLKAYCESMKGFRGIHGPCAAKMRSAAALLNQTADRLKKENRPDRDAEVFDKLNEFRQRAMALRGGPLPHPDKLHEERLQLDAEIRAYCAKLGGTQLAARCAWEAEYANHQLSGFEEDIRAGAFADPPPPHRKYSDTTPVLRCFANLTLGELLWFCESSRNRLNSRIIVN